MYCLMPLLKSLTEKKDFSRYGSNCWQGVFLSDKIEFVRQNTLLRAEGGPAPKSQYQITNRWI